MQQHTNSISTTPWWLNVQSFRSSIQSEGMEPPEDIVPGVFCRFPGKGKKASNRAGWCIMFPNGTAGAFGDWSRGVKKLWFAGKPRGALINRPPVNQKPAEPTAEQVKAAGSARKIWSDAFAASPRHPYLAKKGVQPHGIRQMGNALIIPMMDAEGIQSLQYIYPTGEKRFHTGGRTKGCRFVIGDIQPEKTICLCEGFATGASIHEATGYPVVVAFNANNLTPVALDLRASYPHARIIVCADDDIKTEGNPGVTHATEAALAIGAELALPDFGEDRPDGVTDFNDLARVKGLDAVRKSIEKSILLQEEADQEGVAENQPLAATEIAFPSIEARPCYFVLDEPKEIEGKKYRAGVYYCDVRYTEKKVIPRETWICAPLYIDAVTSDGKGNGFGRLLRFRNSLGQWRTWAMPMELLKGNGEELRGVLLDMGLEISSKDRAKLNDYLQDSVPDTHMLAVTRTGWLDGSRTFVLPNAAFGEDAGKVVFQSSQREHVFASSGSLEDWKKHVSEKAIGNPLLILAISTAFAGPLLSLVQAESGGIHLVGPSSTGKTTALEAARSVWGPSEFRRTWRATANGIEGAAAMFSDTLLALDEIGECDPKEIGHVIYALGNGVGKQRANRHGEALALRRWRAMVLSSGEVSIETRMAEAPGTRVKLGQTVRLLNIPVDGKEGAWDDLHGYKSGAAFSEGLKKAASRYYGTAGRAFVERIASEDIDLLLSDYLDFRQNYFAAQEKEGIIQRAAARFALIALAGALAARYGIVAWSEKEAIAAALKGFNLWKSNLGSSRSETQEAVEVLAGFIDRHGESRITPVKDESGNGFIQVRDRAGWWSADDYGNTICLLTPDALREALRGLDFRRALTELSRAGVLPPPNSRGDHSRIVRIKGSSRRIYEIRWHVLQEKLISEPS